MTGTIIGIITHKVEGDKLTKVRKPVQAETGVYTTVTYATFDTLGRVSGSISKKGEFTGMDQLQRNMIIKANDNIYQIPTDRILTVEQDAGVVLKPGGMPSDVPAN